MNHESTEISGFDGVRLGRRYAHGRRILAAERREEVHAVLLRLDGATAVTARRLLNRVWRSVSLTGVRLRPEEGSIARDLAKAGVLQVEERTAGTAAVYHWEPWRARLVEAAREEVGEALGKLDADAERGRLLAEITGVSLLDAEAGLLAAIPKGAPLRPPSGSATDTIAWSVYAAAMRAAATWARAAARGERVSSRELAAQALGWSKAWTPPRQIAFSKLLGIPFDQAVTQIEPEIRLRGPLWWRVETLIVDAQVCDPWVGLPANRLHTLGDVDCDACGAFVIENLETFEEVCRRSEVPNRWLCLWGAGYVNRGLVRLLRTLDLPIVAWCDLDADGIAIVGDLQRRVDRTVHPVGMNAHLHSRAPYLEQNSQQRAKATRLASDGHPALRELASAVASSGYGCEQETLHYLIPDLAKHLSRFECNDEF